MNRVLQIGSMLLLAVGAATGSNQKEPKDPPPPPPSPKTKAARPQAGAPPAGLPKGAQRLVNPGNIATRLFRMTPEERERVLEQLPPQQQDNARKTLAWFDNLPKETQAVQLRRLEHFEQLAPQKKAEVRQLVAQANQLPPARRALVGRALLTLQQMNDQQRENTLRRPAFQNRFSLEELKIIIGLSDAWMGPL
jgi:hypothetical protein